VEQTVPVNGQQGWTGGGWPAEHQAGDAPTTQFPQPQPAPTGPAWDIPEAHPAPTAAYPVVDGQPGYVIAPAYVPAVPAVGRGSAVLAAVAVDAAAEVVHDDLRAATGQVQGVGAADAATGAGHDRNAAVEVDVTHRGSLSGWCPDHSPVRREQPFTEGLPSRS